MESAPYKNAFCTIISHDYLHYAFALRDSLVNFNNEITLFVFVSCKRTELASINLNDHSNIVLIFTDELCEASYGRDIYLKYFHENLNFFRWSMKAVLMKHILQILGYHKVLYVDGDILFFNSYNFLLDFLDKYSIILSPHNRSLDFKNDESNFNKNFTEGIYNGGFVGVSINAMEALDWWVSACLHACTKNVKYGFYGDQKYLDVFPARFKDVLSLQHMGCNVAEWNKTDCKRTLTDDEVTINGVFKIIFVHFSEHTIIDILNEKDILLMPYLESYNIILKRYKHDFDIINSYRIKIEEAKAKEGISVKESIRLKKVIKRKVKKIFNKFLLR